MDYINDAHALFTIKRKLQSEEDSQESYLSDKNEENEFLEKMKVLPEKVKRFKMMFTD